MAGQRGIGRPPRIEEEEDNHPVDATDVQNVPPSAGNLCASPAVWGVCMMALAAQFVPPGPLLHAASQFHTIRDDGYNGHNTNIVTNTFTYRALPLDLLRLQDEHQNTLARVRQEHMKELNTVQRRLQYAEDENEELQEDVFVLQDKVERLRWNRIRNRRAYEHLLSHHRQVTGSAASTYVSVALEETPPAKNTRLAARHQRSQNEPASLSKPSTQWAPCIVCQNEFPEESNVAAFAKLTCCDARLCVVCHAFLIPEGKSAQNSRDEDDDGEEENLKPVFRCPHCRAELQE